MAAAGTVFAVSACSGDSDTSGDATKESARATGVVLGTLTFSIVQQGIYYTGWNSDWAALILGILILNAVVMNNTFRRMALSSPARGRKKA